MSHLRYQKAIAESMEPAPVEYVLSVPYKDAGGMGLVTTLTCRIRLVSLCLRIFHNQ